VKAARAPQAAPETPVKVEFQVRFSGGPKGRRQAAVTQPAATPEQDSSANPANSLAPEPVKKACLDRVPKITRLLVLGHHFEKLVREGVVKDYAEIARLTGLSRARVTQICNLTVLSPEIQEAILTRPGFGIRRSQQTERDLRRGTSQPGWRTQDIVVFKNPGPSRLRRGKSSHSLASTGDINDIVPR